MKTIISYSVLVSLILLTSCSPASPTYQSPENTVTALPHKTQTTSPPMAFPPTVSSTGSTEQCMGSQQDLPKNIEGEVILGGQSYLYQPSLNLQDTPPFILAFSTSERLTLPQKNGDEVRDFSVSPDKKWLAYYAHQSGTVSKVYIVGNDGTLFNEYPADSWWGVLGWLDNNHLLISKLTNQNPYPSLIFNPFTGEIGKELLPNYPDIFSGNPVELSTWNRYQLSEAVYNSELSLVAYPTNSTIENPSRRIVVWDLKDNKVLNEISDTWATSRAPLWLSNNQYFIVNISVSQDINHPYKDELISMRSDGLIKQLTHLADLPYMNVAIQNYSESADGRYIAFWFAQIRSGPSRLAIYDTVTETTKVFCTIVGGYVPPVWSPSEYQFLVDGTFDKLDNYGTVFVDVKNELLAQLESGVIPIGWMVSP